VLISTFNTGACCLTGAFLFYKDVCCWQKNKHKAFVVSLTCAFGYYSSIFNKLHECLTKTQEADTHILPIVPLKSCFIHLR